MGHLGKKKKYTKESPEEKWKRDVCVFAAVSALQCRSSRPAAYKVVLGVHTERGVEASRQDRNLAKIVMGPNGADIALLKLDT